MAITLAESVSLKKLDDRYVSIYVPRKMGNSSPIAYGGYAIALGIHAAYLAAPDGFYLYSALGHYLHAANTEERLVCTPVELRRTKNFMAFRVSVEQRVPSTGLLRECVSLQIDFHKAEPSVLNYSPRPTRRYTHWQHCLSRESALQQYVKSGAVSEEQLESFKSLFGLSSNLFEGRLCPEGVTSQNLMGIIKKAKTEQDNLHPTEKTSADWIHVKHPIHTEGEQVASLAFIMDGVLSFLALSHNHMFLEDVGVCSSLDFALRVFSPSFNLNDWHLREAINRHAGNGRTFSESNLWSEDGELVACMSQQAILRKVASKI